MLGIGNMDTMGSNPTLRRSMLDPKEQYVHCFSVLNKDNIDHCNCSAMYLYRRWI